MFRIGVDIGGTFTDAVVAKEDGEIVRAKDLTTPSDYTVGVVKALTNASDALGISLTNLLSKCASFVNATTVVTNVIAQEKGRRVGLITTAGFKKQIFIHRGIRDVQLDLQKESRPPDVVKQRHVAEIDERVDRLGSVLIPLAENDVRVAAKRLVKDEGVEALAVCYLWAFRHPQHEQRTRELIHEMYPDMFVTLSSDIYPRIREYERMNTAVLNSFVSEGAESYVGAISRELESLGLPPGRLNFMQSLGGRIPGAEAISEPIRLTNSGPVGGVVAATHFAKMLGVTDIITADVGGTSFDTALIRDLEPSLSHRLMINRLLTGLSAIDVHTVGAGGGSVAWVDQREVPQLGPQSAGAFPGPACYGNGGTEPTITDANLILGLIDPDRFWGGSVRLDVDAARRAFEPIAQRLGRTIEEVAAGYHEIAITHMSTAMSEVSLGRGYDPRDCTVLSYGGGSGLFLAEVCLNLGIKRLVSPRAAATFSAYGLLFADALHAPSTTAEWDLSSGDVETINATYEELECQARERLANEGFTDDALQVRREADMKFSGQSFEISVELPAHGLSQEELPALTSTFVTNYERVYGKGSAWEGFPIQIHTARVVGRGETLKPSVPSSPADSAVALAPVGSRSILLGGAKVEAAVYDGAALGVGAHFLGPALVDDIDTTIYVPQNTALDVDTFGNFVITLSSEDSADRTPTTQTASVGA